MNAILIMLHFFGLAAGFTSSIGNVVVMRLVAASPADAPVLGGFRRFWPALAKPDWRCCG